MTFLIYLAAYLIGSIPTALLFGKFAFGIDIRDHGSNNPGATNTLRVLGKKAAIVVLLVDVGKGAAAAAMPVILNAQADPLIVGMAAVAGHCFPVFAGFRGGKAIATTAGVLLAANIWMFLIAYISFTAIIFLTKYVFFGSLSMGASLLIYSLFTEGTEHELIFSIFLLFLIFLHRSNIKNFIENNEPKINDRRLKDDRIPPRDDKKRA
ncbi:glycerol-3-phosphate 1-O-acyltransferase PlsY [Cytobacillus firmus]|uniref:Glycerol-3-phosphate acyltransferase n=1 Tax=Cytobacillus firmus TaxID=1399 RepID=A0A380X9U2_CYTFI|nr:glycerol-3-phosphate 1-O-acyltransferase PlsY [Cytobacillus firmus]KAF0823352.1 Acyl-phosphate:glycerol-3-phosphate O-acyltransferase PlsY [Cytobacillus firmus]MBG9542513.1 glycerol-3-phosphate acyltransferase [Cytobacillus firmus]MBG9548027.1 glycerol-3-phosphate acyltransferase [Cytobacillus firmus]MBG9554066.1 glycerol-3-phosphate acyltransferase [Cytobacillus firmus]MBG9555579.1 glycerol-3-phosphate acyltransferase [Cytobacillus firmus]